MILELEDWRFEVDLPATQSKTKKNATDHCTCGYCKNYYEAVSAVYPKLIPFLQKFGVDYMGPSEVMPFEPTLILACYRVTGSVLQFGANSLWADDVPISVEIADDSSFFLWVGEMELPWLQQEHPDDVISPANLPEFLARMEEVWLLRHGTSVFQS